LSDVQIAALVQWVEQGAVWPVETSEVAMPSDGPVGDAFTDANNPIRKIWRGQRLDLWSLKPPVNETVPTLDGVTWANPIDAFISEKLVESGMAHSPETDRRTLIRPGPAAIEPPRPETTGRRLALGNWIVSPDNPWTVRVFVNRVWQQHSGIGLVATPNDYGCSGVKPTPPELLDWLAIAFIQRGWSVKQLHRLVVTSATYRQSSRDRDEARKIDPENHLLWQQNIQRLAAETRRDRLLAVSGVLKREGGGPGRNGRTCRRSCSTPSPEFRKRSKVKTVAACRGGSPTPPR